MQLHLAYRTIVLLASLMSCGCVASAQPASGAGELLTPWGAVSGGPSGMAGFVQLRRPTAVSAWGDDVYLADAALRRIYRYSRTRLALEPFTDLAADAAMRLYAAPDSSVYVTDPARARVLQYSRGGQLIGTFRNEIHLGRPVAVALDASGSLLVADGLYGKVVSFNRLGFPLFVAGDPVQSVADMTRGPGGLYLLDRVGRQVVVLGPNGEHRMSFGKGELSQPGAIAADGGGLVFVSDNFDNSISIFSGGKLLKKYGGSGAMPGAFGQIAALWASEGRLYVADSMNARIHILLVTPVGARTEGAPDE